MDPFDHQIKSAYNRYRDQAIRVMNIQQKRSQL